MKRHTATIACALCILAGVLPAAGANPPRPKIQVSHEGGFVAPGYIKTALPELTGYASGLVLMNDVVTTMQRPDLMLLSMRTADIAKLRFYAKAIHAAATRPSGGWGIPNVADVPNTVIRSRFVGYETSVSIYALQFSDGPQVTAAQKLARERLSRSLAALNKYVTRLPARIYKPTQYEAWIFADIVPPEEVGMANPAAVFCESMGGITKVITDNGGSQRGTCTLPDATVVDEWEYFNSQSKLMSAWPSSVTQPTAQCTVVPAAKFATQLSRPNLSGRWVLATGQAAAVVLRPVLPGERACAR